MKKEYLVFLLFVLFVWMSRDNIPPEFQFWKKSHSFVKVQNHSGQDITDVVVMIWSTPNSLGAIRKDQSKELAVRRVRDHTDVIIRFKYGDDTIERYAGTLDEDSNYQMTISVNFAGVVTSQSGGTVEDAGVAPPKTP